MMKRLGALLASVVLFVGCETENAATVHPNRACRSHGGVAEIGDTEYRDNIGWNGNEPDAYTTVICRDGIVKEAVNWN